jgi:hypothetical protein
LISRISSPARSRCAPVDPDGEMEVPFVARDLISHVLFIPRHSPTPFPEHAHILPRSTDARLPPQRISGSVFPKEFACFPSSLQRYRGDRAARNPRSGAPA